MVTIQLNEHSVEDLKSINELRELGLKDEEIQVLYDREQERRKSEVADSD